MIALLEVLYQPGKLFQSLRERRRAWIVPLAANCVLLAIASFLVPHFIGRANLMRQQVQDLRIPEDKKEAAIAAANSPSRVYTGYVGAVVSGVLIHAVVAGMLFAFGLMTARPPGYGSMLAMVSLAFFPYWLVTTAMTALILVAAPDPSSLDVRNLIATNVASWMNRDSMPKGLYSLLSSVDVLSFAEIGLLSFGFSKLTRVNIFFGLAAVVGIWILYVSSKMAISSLF